jgi:[acyl-carrier-protein] S-malonyltransferase
MAPAAEKLEAFLSTCQIGPESAKVITNVSAEPHDASKVCETLVKQLTSPVRWSKSISNLIENQSVTRFLELGTGRILSGLIKRVSKEVSITAISNRDELQAHSSESC